MQTSREIQETSVTFSLAELERLESERQNEEQRARARALDAQDREKREREQAQSRREEARIASELEARRAREREQAEAQAKSEGRAQAQLVVARIQAETKARLDLDTARHEQELEALRIRTELGGRRWIAVLTALLGLALTAGLLGVYELSKENAVLGRNLLAAEQARDALWSDGISTIVRQQRSVEQRFDSLRSRALLHGRRSDVQRLEAMRDRIARPIGGSSSVAASASARAAQISAFSDSLDNLRNDLELAERRAGLDRRWQDLTAAASLLRKTQSAAYLDVARLRDASSGRTDELDAYERSLDRLRTSLGLSKTASANSAHAAAGQTVVVQGSQHQCADGDPLCRFDGLSL